MPDRNSELYEKLGALIQSNQDIKGELKFIHKTIIEDKKDLQALDRRLQAVEKKQYTIVVLATFVWGIIVLGVKKFL